MTEPRILWWALSATITIASAVGLGWVVKHAAMKALDGLAGGKSW